MRMISPGIKNIDPLFVGSCEICKCVMEAKRSEFRDIRYNQIERKEFAYAYCMECGESTLFHRKKDISNA